MNWISAGLLATLLIVGCSSSDPKNDPFLYGKFPDGFLWGTATAAYQIEGAWNVSGKGENIWDRFTHLGNRVANNDTGDVACDSYYKYKEDVQLLKAMGVKHSRFSISWSRIFPNGTKESYNQEGMDYYINVTDELMANGIIPMVTLYHWDLPQPLEDEGGWLNDTVIGHFRDYADKCFEQLGDKVKHWITFNEPFVSCVLGYSYGVHAPGKNDKPGIDPYTCAHNIIRSHAQAYHLYDDTYRQTQKGKVSITLDSDWKEPGSTEQKDIDAALRAMQFKLGWFAHPIFKNGDYPQEMKDIIANKSAMQGYDKSRLPVFTEEEKKQIKGTGDFFGLNHYTTQLIFEAINNYTDDSYNNDQDLTTKVDPEWPRAASNWLYEVPWGLRKLLNWIREQYGDPDIIITENGTSDNDGSTEDDFRIRFYTGYINNVLKAIADGCRVKGYTAWSLLDNFEWASGYTEKFGLHYVDFDDPDRPRKVKKSAEWFKRLIADNGWEEPTTSPPATTPKPKVTTNMSPKYYASIATALCMVVCALFSMH